MSTWSTARTASLTGRETRRSDGAREGPALWHPDHRGPARPVRQASIRSCPRLFIRHAFVQGEWRTHHRFYAKNEAMIGQVEELEDRLRRRDLRVDDETLYAFYDQRVPAEVVSTRHFDTWWKKTQSTSRAVDVRSGDAQPRCRGRRRGVSPRVALRRRGLSAHLCLRARHGGRRRHGRPADRTADDGRRACLRLARARPSGRAGHRADPVAAQAAATRVRTGRPVRSTTRGGHGRGASDLSSELARQMRLLNGTVVQPEDSTSRPCRDICA